MFSFATKEQRDPSKPPALSPGILTPQACVDFRGKFRNFFPIKNTPRATQVAMVVASLQDVCQADWVQANKARLLAFSFDVFFAEFKATFLPLDWETNIRNAILNTWQKHLIPLSPLHILYKLKTRYWKGPIHT